MKKNLFLFLMSLASVSLWATYDYEEEQQGGRVSIGGEALYFKPHISSLELYAGKNRIIQTIDDGTTTNLLNEYSVDPTLQWNFGYRVKADYQFCSGFGTGVIWTHFQDSGTRHIREDADTVNTTKSHLKFDQVDLLMHYQTELFCGFSLKPVLGVRLSKINERINANLVTNLIFSPNSLATLTRSLNDKQNYLAAGPVIGLTSDLDLGCGFGLYGSAVVGLLYGESKVTFNDTSVGTAPISTTNISLDKRRIHTFDWNADLAFGIVWKALICDGYTLGMNLGFEHHQYFNQCHLGVDRGDLTLDGVVFGIDLSL